MQVGEVDERRMALVYNDLEHAEASLDQSLRAFHRLFGTVLDGAEAFGLKYGEPQGPITDMSEGQKLIAQARQHLCRAHEQIRRVAERRGILAFGDTDPSFKASRDVMPATM